MNQSVYEVILPITVQEVSFKVLGDRGLNSEQVLELCRTRKLEDLDYELTRDDMKNALAEDKTEFLLETASFEELVTT